MRKIIYIAIAFVLALTSCVSDEKDIFDDSAANRMSAALKEYKDILTNTPNGWIMEYYAGLETDPTGKTGGYVYLMSFKDDLTVTVASEVSMKQPAKTKKESSYNLIADQGPILTFDTYNEIFHFFSEPSQSDLDGYGGDYEFIVMSASDERIVLKGRRGKHTIVMTPFAENANWDEYIDAVIQQRGKITFPRYIVTANDAPLNYGVVVDPYKNRLEISGEMFSWGDNFTYTPTGVKLYEPVRLGEYEIKTLTWDDDQGQFTTEVNGTTIVLKGFYPEGYSRYDDYIGSYSVQYRNASNAIISKRCSIVELDRNTGTCSIRGLVSRNLTVNYSVALGNLSLSTQYLGTSQYGEVHLLNILGDINGMFVSDQFKYEGGFDKDGLIEFQPDIQEPLFLGMGILIYSETDGYLLENDSDIFQHLILKKR